MTLTQPIKHPLYVTLISCALVVSVISVVSIKQHWSLDLPIQTTSNQPYISQAQATHITPATPENWLNAINLQRTRAGVSPLQLSQQLNGSATAKAQELQRDGWRADNPHLNSAGVIDGPGMALRATGCSYASENLAETSDLDTAMRSFMQSPAHKAAILDPRYEYVGIGVVDGYTVQHFADCF